MSTGWISKCVPKNRLMFLVIHNTLHFNANARNLVTVKDLDHLRLWTSNMVPFRIQLQFQKMKVQLFFNTVSRE